MTPLGPHRKLHYLDPGSFSPVLHPHPTTRPDRHVRRGSSVLVSCPTGPQVLSPPVTSGFIFVPAVFHVSLPPLGLLHLPSLASSLLSVSSLSSSPCPSFPPVHLPPCPPPIRLPRPPPPPGPPPLCLPPVLLIPCPSPPSTSSPVHLLTPSTARPPPHSVSPPPPHPPVHRLPRPPLPPVYHPSTSPRPPLLPSPLSVSPRPPPSCPPPPLSVVDTVKTLRVVGRGRHRRRRASRARGGGPGRTTVATASTPTRTVDTVPRREGPTAPTSRSGRIRAGLPTPGRPCPYTPTCLRTPTYV